MNRSKTNQSRFWKKWEKSGALGNLHGPSVISKKMRQAAYEDDFRARNFNQLMGIGSDIHTHKHGYLDMDDREHRALLM